MDGRRSKSVNLTSGGSGSPLIPQSRNFWHPSLTLSYRRGLSEDVQTRQRSMKSFRKRLEELSMGTLESLLGDVLANQSYLHKLQEIQNLGQLLDDIESTIQCTGRVPFLHRDVAAGLVRKIAGSNETIPILQTSTRLRKNVAKIRSKPRIRNDGTKYLSGAELQMATNSLQHTIQVVGRAWGVSYMIPSGAMRAKTIRNYSSSPFQADGTLDTQISNQSSSHIGLTQTRSFSGTSSQHPFPVFRNKLSKLRKEKILTTEEKRSYKREAKKKTDDCLKHTCLGNSVDQSYDDDTVSVVLSESNTFPVTAVKNEIPNLTILSSLTEILGEKPRSRIIDGSTQTTADAATGLDFIKHFQDAGVDPLGTLEDSSSDSTISNTRESAHSSIGTTESTKSHAASREGKEKGNLSGSYIVESNSAIAIPTLMQVTPTDIGETDSRQLVDIYTDQLTSSAEKDQSFGENEVSRDSTSATYDDLSLHYGTAGTFAGALHLKKSQSSESVRVKSTKNHSTPATLKQITSDMRKDIVNASADAQNCTGKVHFEIPSSRQPLAFANDEIVLGSSFKQNLNDEKATKDSNCSGDENFYPSKSNLEEKHSAISSGTTNAKTINNIWPGDSECGSILHYTLKEYGIDNADTELYETAETNSNSCGPTPFTKDVYFTEENLLDHTFNPMLYDSSVDNESITDFVQCKCNEYGCACTHSDIGLESTSSMIPVERTESMCSVADEMVDDVLLNLSFHEFWLNC